MKLSLSSKAISPVLDRLKHGNLALNAVYSGETPDRQPVHTVYGGAHLFSHDTAGKLGRVAVRSLEEFAANGREFADALGIVATDASQDKWLADTVYSRVKEKLQREAIEDFRIDFEDGFGIRPDAEEDAVAEQAAKEVALGMKNKTLPPFIGIRIKTLNEELKGRAVRTLDIFITTLLSETGKKFPENFVVTLPKVTHKGQVVAFVEILKLLEQSLNLPAKTIKFEIMIETTQSILNDDGQSNLQLFIKSGDGRIVAAHFGTYDYTASCNITAAWQSMDHQACDFARHMMKVAYAGQPIWLSDGATNVMPVGPHRASKDGPALTAKQLQENKDVVHRAWKLAFNHVTHSLRNAFYQGWDLHPAQFPVRYAACYAFFLDGLKPATDRLRTFIEKAAQATLLGDVFDDAATGQGLLNFFLRALNCGAITIDEVLATGLKLDEIQSRSFLKILENRKKLG
jgi:citrate lyase beta subunit